MDVNLVDANVILRYLVEKPDSVDAKFSGVFPFFEKVESDEIQIFLSDLVLFEAFFVLTSFYKMQSKNAASILYELIQFPGIRMTNKTISMSCLDLLIKRNIGLVDAWIVVTAREWNSKGIFSYDQGFEKYGLTLLKIE